MVREGGGGGGGAQAQGECAHMQRRRVASQTSVVPPAASIQLCLQRESQLRVSLSLFLSISRRVSVCPVVFGQKKCVFTPPASLAAALL